MFSFAENLKHVKYKRGLTSVAYKFFDKKKHFAVVFKVKLCWTSVLWTWQIAEDLHEAIIRKLEKGKVHSYFTDNIWSTNIADMETISKFKKGFSFLLCVIDIYSKYVRLFPLKDKKR